MARFAENQDDSDNNMSIDSRGMTLKDRQEQMNKRHPFGLPIWKPALYKKSRSVVRKANKALHSYPSSSPELFLNPGNALWLLVFGWWLALIMITISIALILVPPDGYAYSRVTRELAYYLFWPFGRYVECHGEPSILSSSSGSNKTAVRSDTGSIYDDGETEDEEAGVLGGSSSSTHTSTGAKTKRRKEFTRSILQVLKTGPAGCTYYVLYFTVITPVMFTVSAICWMCVITIPMSKLNFLLLRHLRRYPLSLRFKSNPSGQTERPARILLCTYQAIGFQYYKYTYDGINILFINLIPLVFFVILDEFLLKQRFPDSVIAAPATVFALSLASVIPLSYFIGMGISSVSAQSRMGIGAFLNASFGSIIEIILYAVALMNGKSTLVEGALIGSLMAGVLLLPGCSMVSGSVRRKEQKFNAKSAEVTSTMLIMAIIGALTPTLFYQLFGSFELRCNGCSDMVKGDSITCSRCHYDQMNPINDPVYQNNVKPLMYFCAAILPSAYVIGIVFSLRTHSLGAAYVRVNDPNEDDEDEDEGVGHDSPNWSKAKSFTVLFGCTLLYSIIAEVLVDTVDEAMGSLPMDEKFLGLTLFALVPNITEFMNAMSFAMYGNIVLSMEIGSAYALQVCLLQIPAMVAFSFWYNCGKDEVSRYSFSLVFPRWDVICVIFSVFLLTYTYQEGRSNYFKGSILILSYCVLMAGFYFTPPYTEKGTLIGVNQNKSVR
ncbi:Sodium/calcium exchanger protein-domain-containing protein [Dichotomocladium elegans]|nr:Sodium/calcium exchanger protein-domain-containing protein [Dichotomocladium elegans]